MGDVLKKNSDESSEIIDKDSLEKLTHDLEKLKSELSKEKLDFQAFHVVDEGNFSLYECSFVSSEVVREYAQMVNDYGIFTRVKGFRKGHVPFEVSAAVYDEQIKQRLLEVFKEKVLEQFKKDKPEIMNPELSLVVIDANLKIMAKIIGMKQIESEKTNNDEKNEENIDEEKKTKKTKKKKEENNEENNE